MASFPLVIHKLLIRYANTCSGSVKWRFTFLPSQALSYWGETKLLLRFTCPPRSTRTLACFYLFAGTRPTARFRDLMTGDTLIALQMGELFECQSYLQRQNCYLNDHWTLLYTMENFSVSYSSPCLHNMYKLMYNRSDWKLLISVLYQRCPTR